MLSEMDLENVEFTPSLKQLQCALNQTSSENENSIENSSAIPVAALVRTLVTSGLVLIELIDV